MFWKPSRRHQTVNATFDMLGLLTVWLTHRNLLGIYSIRMNMNALTRPPIRPAAQLPLMCLLGVHDHLPSRISPTQCFCELAYMLDGFALGITPVWSRLRMYTMQVHSFEVLEAANGGQGARHLQNNANESVVMHAEADLQCRQNGLRARKDRMPSSCMHCSRLH